MQPRTCWMNLDAYSCLDESPELTPIVATPDRDMVVIAKFKSPASVCSVLMCVAKSTTLENIVSIFSQDR